MHHPQVLSVMLDDVPPSKVLHAYEWNADQPREGNCDQAKEHSIGKKAWGKMIWEGEIPSEDLCSAQVDGNFLMNFLKSRPYMPPKRQRQRQPEKQTAYNTFCDALFTPVVDKEDGWLYYGLNLHSVTKAFVETRLLAGWLKGFHASRMACVHSIVCNGLRDATQRKQNCPGVYHYDRLMRGGFYHRYQLFDDGTAYCIVWYILADPEKTFRIPEDGPKTRSLEKKNDADQWATEESGVMILGAYIRGYTMSQIKSFCQNATQRPISTLVSQWQPKLEADVGRQMSAVVGRQM